MDDITGPLLALLETKSAVLSDVDLVPRQATFARFTSSRSALS
jgi:hypothetical protein